MWSFLYIAVLAASVSPAEGAITSLSQLYDEVANGESQKVGFLSDGNYESVKVVLPNNVEKVIIGHVQDLYDAVKNGTIVAGLISGIPEDESLHVFSSTLVSPRTSLLKKDMLSDCDGEEYTGSEDLRQAWDAAITRAIGKGKYAEIEEKHEPFEGIASFSCSPDDDAFAFPTEEEATGMLKDVLMSGKLRVAALGPYNWGVDGNYQVTPATGFWPEYMDAIFGEFQLAYPGVEMERVWYETSGETMDAIVNEECHLSEPYWVQPSFYNGVPRSQAFKMSCTTMGYESRFFTKMDDPEPSDDDGLSEGAIIAIVISSVVAFAFLVMIVCLVHHERRGRPMFAPLLGPSKQTIGQVSTDVDPALKL